MRHVFSMLLTLAPVLAGAEVFSVESPDRANAIRLETGDRIQISIFHAGQLVLQPSEISLALAKGSPLGAKPVVRSSAKTASDISFTPVMYAKRARVRDHFNQLEVRFGGGYSLILRAYDDGVAYRWRTTLPGEVKVRTETAALRFAGDPTAYLQMPDCKPGDQSRVADCFHFNYESAYTVKPLRDITATQRAVLPLLIAPENGPKVLITEADLLDYPGMWLTGAAKGASGMDAIFPACPLEEKLVGTEFPQRIVTRRADFIAKTRGTRSFPWRVFLIADRDTDLIESDIVYRLGGETPRGDWSWLRPGKSQSEWVQDNRLDSVPFRSGYNFETYKYYVDFNERFKTGYVFFDAGWSEVSDPLKQTPAMRVPELIQYAHEKGLRVGLWTLSAAMETRMVEILDALQRMGVEGVMIDFMDRDDQKMVNFYERAAQETAKRHMWVNFHGAYKPTGLERRYPNAITREALKASEYFKWIPEPTPEQELTVPFIRMVAGPVDYEPGAMKNAQKDDFRAVGGAPMSMGTRMHQVALYVVYESPYSKMAGNVSDYLREPEITQFMADVPTVWKETRVLDAKLADYVVVAREAANGDFYVGALTDWSPREFTVDLSFLASGRYRAEIYSDGPNADKTGMDHVHDLVTVERNEQLKVRLAPGGGWVARISPEGNR